MRLRRYTASSVSTACVKVFAQRLTRCATQHITAIFATLATVFPKNKMKYVNECKDDGAVMMKLVKLRSLPFSWDAYEDAPEGDYNHY